MTTSATQSLPATDRFSWRRVGLVARYYYKPLKRPLIIFPLLSLAVGIFSLLSMRYNISLFFAGTLSTILSFLYYWSPVVFNRVESSQLTTTLPCRWSERATFVMPVALLGMPLLIFGPSYALSELGTYLYPDTYTSQLARLGAEDTTFFPDYIAISLKVVMGLMPFSVSLYVIYRARKNRVLKAILLSVAAMIVETITYGVIIGLIVMDAVKPNITGDTEFTGIHMDQMLDGSLYTACAVGAVALIFIVLTIRRFKTTQLS
ncbi:MAG: hypothetical protein K2H74_00610 [Paramuribaculum sp.]|nr:hypothetical protein [Paramuribaculum sp.]